MIVKLSNSKTSSIQVVRPIRGVAKLLNKKQIAHFVYEFTFEMVEPLEIQFRSGQYIAIEVDAKTRRQYSISSAPQNTKQFQMIVDIKPNGVGVNYLMNLKAGNETKLIGQIGLFVLPQNLDKTLYFVSTGTGLAPLKSMIEDLIACGEYKNHEIKVIFGTRYIDDIFYEETFNEYLDKGLIEEYKIYLSRPDKDYSKIEQGYVTKYFNDIANDKLKNAQFFICGGNEMIKSLEELLIIKGVDKERIIYEKFY